MSLQTPDPISPRLLVIGYGNTLRADDAAGPAVATAIEALQLPGAATIACHQLMPEMADPISHAQRVVFVDADISGISEPRLSELAPGASKLIMAHAASPESLLALARDLYGRVPQALLLGIPASNLELGESFSEETQRGIATAIDIIRKLAEGE